MDSKFVSERREKPDDIASDQVLTLAIHENLSLETGFRKPPSNKEGSGSEPAGDNGISNTKDHDEVVINGEVRSPQLRGIGGKLGGKGSFINNSNKSFYLGPRSQEDGPYKVTCHE